MDVKRRQKAEGTRQNPKGTKQNPKGARQKAGGTRDDARGRKREADGGRAEGHLGWDEYAPFYDWENARTLGRRDVPFWRRLVQARGGRVLELGCGTGRVTIPLARTQADVVGVDRSAAMLARGRTRIRRAKVNGVSLVRADIRLLPFAKASFGTVIAPYGVLQSLLSDRDLTRTLDAVARMLPRGGVFGLELVADLPEWREYRRRVALTGRRGRSGAPITLVESVRQDRTRGLTLFDQEFVEGQGSDRRRHQFTLAFRTVSVPQMARRLERSGFEVTALLGDYRGGPWDPRAEVWIVLAKRA